MEAALQTGLSLRVRTLFIGLLAGFAAGMLNAVVARVLMRVIALLETGRGSFSIGGTAMIFFSAALAGPLFGAIYRLTLYKIHAPNLVKGLLFGLVLVVLIQVPSLYISPDFRLELMAVGLLGFAIFAIMNLSFVLTLALLVPWLEKAWPKDATRQRSELVVTTVLGLLAAAGLVLLLVEMVARPLGLIGN